jgi:hypothetical protein
MATPSKVIQKTDEFFRLHWLTSEIKAPPPAWEIWEPFLFGSVPNYDLGGCYALFESDSLIYLGLGASRGGGIYKEHGISRRLMSHVIKADRSRTKGAMLRDKWENITAIYTIGFPSNFSYMAASLEGFLIRQLKPNGNFRV